MAESGGSGMAEAGSRWRARRGSRSCWARCLGTCQMLAPRTQAYYETLVCFIMPTMQDYRLSPKYNGVFSYLANNFIIVLLGAT